MRVHVLLLLSLPCLLFPPSVIGFSVIYNDRPSHKDRKLFGGYRIVPKPCRSEDNVQGICMFNYECSHRQGTVISACMDGFLFGACCHLPESATVEIPLSEIDSEGGIDNGDIHNGLPSPEDEDISITDAHPELINSMLINPNQLVSPHPESDTILVHPNGSTVNGDMTDNTFRLPDSHFTGSIQLDDETIFLTSTNSPSDETNESETDSDYKTVITEKPTTEGKHTTYYFPHKKPSGITRPVYPDATTINEVEYEKITTKDPHPSAAPAYYSTRWPGIRPTHGAKPSHSTHKVKPSFFPTTLQYIDNEENFVRIPTITVSYEDTKLPQESVSEQTTVPETQSESIIHILTMLNNTVSQGLYPPSTTPGILSTWLSIDGSPSGNWQPQTTYRPSTSSLFVGQKPANTAAVYFTPPRRPTLTTNAVLSGPQVSLNHPSITASPTKLDPAPTVIVLGPVGGDITSPHPPLFNTNKDKYSTLVTKRPSITQPLPPNWIHTSTLGVSNKPGLIFTKPSIPETVGIITKYPQTTPGTITKWPAYITHRPFFTTLQDINTEAYVTSFADLINFPPVRNPQLNLSASVNQQENPSVVQSTEETPPETPVPDNDILDNDITTPNFLVDQSLNNKLHGFVNHVVNSLKDDFINLEDIVLNRKNVSFTSTIGTPLVSRPFVTSTKRPSATSSRRPTPSRTPTNTTTSTKPLKLSTLSTTKSPITSSTSSKRPTTTRPSTSSKPKPSTVKASTTKKPPTKKTTPSGISTGTTVTKRPTPVSVTTTKKPKPTKRSTTTTSTTQLVQDESQEISTKPVTSKKTTTTTTTPAPLTITTTEQVTEVVVSDNETSTAKPVNLRNECGIRPLMKKNGRIVGGKGATFGEWPWQVLVKESTWLGLFTKNKCGGVLITNKFVITAAHCQPGFLANLVAVFGEYDISGELESKRSVTKNVRRVIVHRHYESATFANDLALLELESPVTFDEHIVPICMPRDHESLVGRMATVTGWGRLKYGGGVPSVLQEVQVPVIENSVCQEMFHTAGHTKIILNSFLCAGYANGQKDSCEGDSGGPLMLEREDGRWELIGTVSHGIKCAAPYLPGVYMRTAYYKPWLKSITGVQ